MVVRCYWRDCDLRGGEWGAPPIDAFWVEATLQEAEFAVFPLLSSKAVEESRRLAAEFKELAEELATPARPFCFLVPRDLSAIDPFHVHYPIHQLWDAYSPFRSMSAMNIDELAELKNIVLPSRDPEDED